MSEIMNHTLIDTFKNLCYSFLTEVTPETKHILKKGDAGGMLLIKILNK